MNDKLRDAIIGLAVGDALGVPHEFKERDTFECVDMIGYGTHNQPAGTWSDDTSMTLATLKSLKSLGKIDLNDIMTNFELWLYYGYFTRYRECFDVGRTTKMAIQKYLSGIYDVHDCGGDDIYDNGNGSLMRILPLAFTNCDMKDVAAVSSLTHAHPIAIQACQIYVLIARKLLSGSSVNKAIENVCYSNEWLEVYNCLNNIDKLNRDEIRSSGYVVDTLKAALWCLLKTDNYRDCVLTAVNLGEDTDTVAAVAGGLAGIMYGERGIPKKWIKKTEIRKYIDVL